MGNSKIDENNLANLLSGLGVHRPLGYDNKGYEFGRTPANYIFAKGETNQSAVFARNAYWEGTKWVASDASKVSTALVLENDGTLKFLYGAAAANPTLSQKLKVDTSGNIIMQDGSYIGQSTGPNVTFDDTNNYLEIMGCNVGIGLTSPTISDGTGLHLAGKILRIGTAKTPASAGATGNPFEVCVDSNFLYICVGTNSWKRAALSVW